MPRALAFEHRIAAGVVDPGGVDVSTTVLGHLPHTMIKLLEAGEREKFNRDMDWTLKISPSTRSLLALRMRPYGVTTPYEFFPAARDYVLSDKLIAQITTPILVTANRSSTGSMTRPRPDRGDQRDTGRSSPLDGASMTWPPRLTCLFRRAAPVEVRGQRGGDGQDEH